MMINIKIQKNRGQTLLELVLYIAMASILLTVITTFLFFFIELRIREQTISEVDEQGRQIMQMITGTLRNADSINLPTSGNTGSTLSVSVLDLADNPSVFSLSGDLVMMAEGSGSSVNLNNGRTRVTNLVFRNLSLSGTPGNIQVEFTIEYANNTDRYEYNYQKTFYDSISIRY